MDCAGTHFEITDRPITSPDLSLESAGAHVVFEGWVRDHHQGREVVRLEYEAYVAMAVKEGEKVMAEAASRFPVQVVWCAHRVGALEIGDVAVRIDVLAGHRQEAFAACSWIIDAIKERVPIWKKETYREGDATWVNVEGPGAP